MPGEAVESRMHPRHSSMALMPPKPCSALYYRSLSRARPPREAEPEQDLEQREQRQYREHQRRKAEQQRWRQHDPRLIGVGQQPVKAPLLARILVQRAREQDRRGEARSEEHTSELQSLMRTSY